MAMKALVTGSTGFVGAAVSRCLLERGVDVRVLVRRDSDLRNLEGLKVEQAYGDLRDTGSLRQALASCRHLYHVAALYALWAPDPQIFYDTNVTGTRNLMEAALDSGADELAGLPAMHALQRRQVNVLAFRLDVGHLSPHHPGIPGAA